jgi:cytochrome c oxidase subunit 4
MITHQTGEHVQGKRIFLYVWGYLLALTVFEVLLAYQQLNLKTMLVILMGLSVVKASLIISYFMHLRYERRSLAMTLMPALVFVIAMMFAVFPDSLRLLQLGIR